MKRYAHIGPVFARVRNSQRELQLRLRCGGTKISEDSAFLRERGLI